MSWPLNLLAVWLLLGLLVVMVLYLVTGRAAQRFHFEVERHPIAWIPLALVCILTTLPLFVFLAIIVVFVVPVFAILSGFGFWRIHRTGHRIRFLDQGLEIYNDNGTAERLIEWTDIEGAEELFEPPLICPQLVLRDGERVWLHMAKADELAPQLEQHGIPFELLR